LRSRDYRSLSVHHFGPDRNTVGGIATVIRLFVEHRIGCDQVFGHPTWRPHAPLARIRVPGASLAALAAATVLRLTPSSLVHLHLSERGSFLREGALLTLVSRRGLTAVATLHGADFLPFAAKHPRLTSAVLRRAHLISCLDSEVQATVARLAPSVPCEIIPNPVTLADHLTPADQTPELVLFAGEANERKGADVLHRAWPIIAAQRPAARCLIVGPHSNLRLLDIERLEIRPPVQAREIKRLISSARVIALPSRAEGMPMILAEAMSCARPFVSTPVGGIPQLAAGGGGILVPVEDHHALAQRLIELLADPAQARQLGERGRRYCEQTRGIAVIDRRWRGLYETAAVRPRA
jgi:glycosyltransferase involved in cell wall biosynthesis